MVSHAIKKKKKKKISAHSTNKINRLSGITVDKERKNERERVIVIQDLPWLILLVD